MELAKKIIAGFLLAALAAVYLGSIIISIIVVWPVGWWWALIQFIVAAFSGPIVWALGEKLLSYILDKQ